MVVSRSVISDAFNSFGYSSDHRGADILILKAVTMIERALSLLEAMFCSAILGYLTKISHLTDEDSYSMLPDGLFFAREVLSRF